jgi:putative ABC transport system permease protein
VAVVDRNVPVAKVRTMDRIIADSVATPRSMSWLLACFAGLALTLAAVGLYGLISYGVSRRTHEIGLRMALGAGARQVGSLVLGRAFLLTLVGTALGLAAALAATRLLAGMLFEISARDPIVFAAAPLVLAAIALAAAYLPARRAMRLDPTAALREE